MKIVRNYELEAVEGKTINRDGEYICICPICSEDISSDIDDFDTAFYCPVCDNAVKFPESEIVKYQKFDDELKKQIINKFMGRRSE